MLEEYEYERWDFGLDDDDTFNGAVVAMNEDTSRVFVSQADANSWLKNARKPWILGR